MTYANDMTSTSDTRAEVPPTVSRAQCRPAPLAAELRVALMRSVRKIRQQRSNDAITDTQYSVLAFLDHRGPLTPRELATHEQVQPPSMTRTLNSLTEAGLVQRTEHPDDGRQVLIAITEAGTREVKETRRRRDAWLAQQLAGLEHHERELLAQAAQILRRVVDQ